MSVIDEVVRPLEAQLKRLQDAGELLGSHRKISLGVRLTDPDSHEVLAEHEVVVSRQMAGDRDAKLRKLMADLLEGMAAALREDIAEYGANR